MKSEIALVLHREAQKLHDELGNSVQYVVVENSLGSFTGFLLPRTNQFQPPTIVLTVEEVTAALNKEK